MQSATLPNPEPQMTATFGRYSVLERSHWADVLTASSRLSSLKHSKQQQQVTMRYFGVHSKADKSA